MEMDVVPCCLCSYGGLVKKNVRSLIAIYNILPRIKCAHGIYHLPEQSH